MSKAFTKEKDTEDSDESTDLPSSLPAGAKNYITPRGLQKLRDELHQLLQVERPAVTKVVSWAAENGDRSENADYQYGKKRLREIDRRVRFLSKRLDTIEVVDPLEQAKRKVDQVFFGATVTIQFDDEEKPRTYSIVGVDEVDADRGWISWISPLANALLKARIGDVIEFRSPKGLRGLEILDLQYRDIGA